MIGGVKVIDRKKSEEFITVYLKLGKEMLDKDELTPLENEFISLLDEICEVIEWQKQHG